MAAVPPLTNIRGRGAPLKWTFSIGGFVFGRFEAPAELKLGVDVETKTHKYISEIGRPVVRTHTQGAFLTQTSWKGVFTSLTALERAQAVQRLATLGKPTLLVYGPYKWHVIIQKFHYTVKWQTEVDYEIDVQLVDDLNGQAQSPEASSFSAETDLYYTQGVAASADLTAVDASLPIALSSAQAVVMAQISAAYPLGQQPYGSLVGVSNSLNALDQQFAAYLITRGGKTTQSALGQYAAAELAKISFVLLNNAIKRITTAKSPTTNIVTQDTSLLAVSAKYYPKINPVAGAQYLAQANNLTSFFIVPGTSLYIPPITSPS